MDVTYIKANITGIIGKDIVFFENVGSTNTIAEELSEKASEGTVVIADSQEKGRGRLGRIWISPAGVNIYMSVILNPSVETMDATLITIMAAVACAKALRSSTNLDVTIKWPNDLIVSGKKLGGILTDLKIGQGRILAAVVGIGININSDTDTFPYEVSKIATSVRRETGNIHSREDIAIAILNEMSRCYEILQGKDKKTLLSEWKQLTSTLGKEVMVVVGEETLNGVAESIDDEGRLIIKVPSGETKRISAGDLTVLR